MAKNNDNFDFEENVIRIARAKWPQAEFSGSEMIDGRERDGVFETDEAIHFIEVTISRSQDKAKQDGKKIFELIKKYQIKNPMKVCKGWFITKDEPTADQRSVINNIGNRQITICTLNDFQRSIIDVHAYLSARENHFFGSVLNQNNQSDKPDVDYVPLDIIDSTQTEPLSICDISSNLLKGKTYILQGDYGAGKSMTLRQVFFDLKKKFTNGAVSQFPIYLNLREHSGQDNPSELIERHARNIGFSKPSSLVRAWKAGFCVVLIDGYDEITTLGASNKLKLKNIRRESLTAVRRLIEQSPEKMGWIIAGREHFFDSYQERNSALGLNSNSTTKTLSLNEFSDEQIKQYLEKLDNKASLKLPAWLPTRPLFVGYMAARGLLQDVFEKNNLIDPVEGWDFLIGQICERESKMAKNFDAQTLRLILERLSTIARATQDGLGPINQTQIREAFFDICDYEPDEQANLILQRMPGLGVYRVEEDTRTFIDVTLAEVCRGGDIAQFVIDPHKFLQNKGWKKCISEISKYSGNFSIDRASHDLRKRQIKQGNFDGAFQSIKNTEQVEVLKADLVSLCLQMGFIPFQSTIISGVEYDEGAIRFGSEINSASNVIFDGCIFDTLEIDSMVNIENMPQFKNCIINELIGRSSTKDLPIGKFYDDCVFDKFSNSALTQASILEIDSSKGVKIILTLLRKLFVQSLGGRAESALIRGLDLNDRQRVAPALQLLEKYDFAVIFNRGDGNVWLPNRKRLHHVRQLLAAPSSSSEPLFKEAKNL